LIKRMMYAEGDLIDLKHDAAMKIKEELRKM
jgi:hypothetical protein